MSTYDSLQIFQNRLREVAVGTQNQGEQDGAGAGRANHDHTIPDSKLKQFYEIQSQIGPFFTGGKVVPLSPIHFASQCGSEVKLVSSSAPIKNEEPRKGPDEEEAELEDPEDKEKKSEKASSCSFQILGTIGVELDEILTFDSCPGTHTLITGHKSGLLRLWDSNSMSIARTIKSLHSVPIHLIEVWKGSGSSSFSNLGTEASAQARNGLLWSTVGGNGVKIWDSGGSVVSKMMTIGDLPSLGFMKWDYSQFGKVGEAPRLWVAERNLYAIDLVSGASGRAGAGEWKITQVLEGHLSQITGLEWYEDGGLMISGARDKTLILWSTKSDSYTKLTSIAFPGIIDAMTLINREDLYISSSGILRHFDIKTKKLYSKPAFSLSNSGDEELEDEGQGILTICPPLNQGHKDFGDELDEFFVYSHTTCLLCKVGQKPRTEKKHTKKSKSAKKLVKLVIKKMFVGSLEEILDIALIWGPEESGDPGLSIAVANNTSSIKLFNFESGNCELLQGHRDIVLCLRAKGQVLVSGSKDNRICIWEIGNSLSPTHILEGHLGSVSSVTIGHLEANGPCGILYSVSEDTFLKAWTFDGDGAAGKCTKSVVAHEKEIHVVDCSPNGRMIATGSRDKTIKIWSSAPTLSLLTTLKGHKKSVWDARFSQWDQLLVSSSADSTLKIWNLTGGNYSCLFTLQGHGSSVLRGTFINSGLQIISSSTDGTWRVWDCRNSVCLGIFEGSDSDKIWALDSQSDGNLVLTGSGDSKLILWKDITQSKIKEALSKRNQFIQDEQELSNVLRRGDWTEGMRLAVELDRPFTMLKIIREIPDISFLRESILDLLPDYSSRILKYIEKWNSNGRTSTEAQSILNLILKSIPPGEIYELFKTTGTAGTRDGNLISLIPYTEKHFARLIKAQQQISLVGFLANET